MQGKRSSTPESSLAEEPLDNRPASGSAAPYPRITFGVEEAYRDVVASLPWEFPIETWKEGLIDLFPGRTAAELYVDVMTHKYFLSRARRTDIGLIESIRDYTQEFGNPPEESSFWGTVVRKLGQILGWRESWEDELKKLALE